MSKSADLEQITRDLGAAIRRVNARFSDPSLELMSSLWYLTQYSALHRTIDRLVAPGGAVLDWGAGIGHFAFVQSRCGREVVAYSPQPTDYNCYNEVLAELAGAGRFSVVVGDDPVRLPFPDNSFEAVVSCGVLEHVREFGGDDLGSLREIHRILKPEGVFACVHLPNRFSWIEWINRKLGKTHHRYTYDAGDVRRLTRAAGLSIVTHHRYGVLPKLRVARLMGSRADDRAVVNSYYALDRAASSLFASIAQNHFFIACKAAVVN